ncbi:Zn-ribbon domain-containing OB-fold protein [Rhodococcus sp. NPDC127530]|uniref:Zn-ribbon domain-containing OB-fold protein n=1 Tax=unclassified Rhodococcus (in: high G+C Gram-positive bacteria) TaxID=192944 RepID=UPI00363D8929
MTESDSSETAKYLEGLASGKLLYQQCADCEAVVWRPRHLCPECWGTSLNWLESARTGTVYTFTAVHVAPTPAWAERVPYTIASIELGEGFWVMVHIAEDEVDTVQIGDQVEVIAGDGDVPLVAHKRKKSVGGTR